VGEAAGIEERNSTCPAAMHYSLWCADDPGGGQGETGWSHVKKDFEPQSRMSELCYVRSTELKSSGSSSEAGFRLTISGNSFHPEHCKAGDMQSYQK
jgi:hypothetical protein